MYPHMVSTQHHPGIHHDILNKLHYTNIDEQPLWEFLVIFKYINHSLI